MFTEHLLCARLCANCWGHRGAWFLPSTNPQIVLRLPDIFWLWPLVRKSFCVVTKHMHTYICYIYRTKYRVMPCMLIFSSLFFPSLFFFCDSSNLPLGFYSLLVGGNPPGWETQLSVACNACIVLHINYVLWEKRARNGLFWLGKSGEAPGSSGTWAASGWMIGFQSTKKGERQPERSHSKSTGQEITRGPRRRANGMWAVPFQGHHVRFSELPHETELFMSSC